MILTVPLQAGTSLGNVRYVWIVSGVAGLPLSTGITQPDASFPVFRFNVTPPSGAEELVAYDTTNLANWNPGGYLLALAAASELAPPPQPPLPPLIQAGLGRRTIKFRTVYESIIRRMGYNPRGDAVKEDVAQNVLQHINDRVRLVWSIWDWPDLNLVEWRAFRTIWTSALQFQPGDDLYYFGDGISTPLSAGVDPPNPGPNAGYYTCIVQPPVGTLPTNTGYFSPLTLTDRYIAYSQINQNTIGDMLDVYPQNPRETRWSRILKIAPSSKGIDVRTSLDIVWIRYRIPVPEFTLTPLFPGTTGLITFYDPDRGDCFMASASLTGPLNPIGGTLVPFPSFLAGYVRPAAYADAILETTMEQQMRVALSQIAMGEAEQYLQSELDKLAVAGQQIFYPAFPSRHRRYRWPRVSEGAVPQETFGGFT